MRVVGERRRCCLFEAERKKRSIGALSFLQGRSDVRSLPRPRLFVPEAPNLGQYSVMPCRCPYFISVVAISTYSTTRMAGQSQSQSTTTSSATTLQAAGSSDTTTYAAQQQRDETDSLDSDSESDLRTNEHKIRQSCIQAEQEHLRTAIATNDSSRYETANIPCRQCNHNRMAVSEIEIQRQTAECYTCRSRRKRCDQRKPTCGNCEG